MSKDLVMSCLQTFPWIVVFASFIIRAIVYGITYTSGIVYVIVLDNFETGEAATSWITSIITTVMFAAGTCPSLIRDLTNLIVIVSFAFPSTYFLLLQFVISDSM